MIPGLSKTDLLTSVGVVEGAIHKEFGSGVALIRTGDGLGTGTLLSGSAGRAILTSAHLFVGASTDRLSVSFAGFDWPSAVLMSAGTVHIHPQFSIDSLTNDLAVLWLEKPAPYRSERFQLFRSGDELGERFYMAGYGLKGSGNLGADSLSNSDRSLAWGTNHFDAFVLDLAEAVNDQSGWLMPGLDRLVADFDNGLYFNDALSRFLDERDFLPIEPTESMIAQGDSGGPAFIDGKIAGVASLVARLETPWVNPDIDDVINSSFGEVGVWQRVGIHQQFIDQSIRRFLSDEGAPTRAEQVSLEIREGSGVGVSPIVYFLITLKNRTESSGLLEVSYATRDGTAVAGQDYVAEQGVTVFYPGEESVSIPVQIIADFEPEDHEEFFLDLFDPVGASFGNELTVLSASRRILDDDLFI